MIMSEGWRRREVIQTPHGSFLLIESRGGIFELLDISTQPVAAIYTG